MSEPKTNPSEWQELLDDARPWYRTLGENLRAFLAPPVICVTSARPVKAVYPEVSGWARGVGLRQLGRSELLSALAHALVLTLLTIQFTNGIVDRAAKGRGAELLPFDLGEYKLTYPGRMGGGGGGGDRSPLAASRGRLPKSSLDVQLTPSLTVMRNSNPRLTAEPTVVVPPEIVFQNPDVPAYGEPKSNALIPSGGPGGGGGSGEGCCGGHGPGDGRGRGPGEKYGFGGDQPVYRPGGKVSFPACVYCPDPEYSDEARKARYQGAVLLWAVVDEEGRVRDIRIQQSLGMGLDEQAIRAVQSWRFKPAERLGKPVPVMMSIQVEFRLY